MIRRDRRFSSIFNLLETDTNPPLLPIFNPADRTDRASDVVFNAANYRPNTGIRLPHGPSSEGGRPSILRRNVDGPLPACDSQNCCLKCESSTMSNDDNHLQGHDSRSLRGGNCRLRFWTSGKLMKGTGVSRTVAAVVVCSSFLVSELQSQEPEVPPSLSQTTLPPIPAKLQRYARWVLQRHDANRDGRLQPDEFASIPRGAETLDRDNNGVVTEAEIAADTWEYALRHPLRPADSTEVPTPAATPAANQASRERAGPRRDLRFFVRPGRLPEGLPDWFLTKDQDGDAQLTLAEFSPDGRSDLAEFHRLDANSDGVLTAMECVGRKPDKNQGASAPPPPATTPKQ